MTIFNQTIFELRFGAGGHVPETTRYFGPSEECDAAVRLSAAITSMDGDPAISGAYASLKRLPDSIYPEGRQLVFWTKTSDERPTSEGSLYPCTEEQCPDHVASASDPMICGRCGVHVRSFDPDA